MENPRNFGYKQKKIFKYYFIENKPCKKYL